MAISLEQAIKCLFLSYNIVNMRIIISHQNLVQIPHLVRFLQVTLMETLVPLSFMQSKGLSTSMFYRRASVCKVPTNCWTSCSSIKFANNRIEALTFWRKSSQRSLSCRYYPRGCVKKNAYCRPLSNWGNDRQTFLIEWLM